MISIHGSAVSSIEEFLVTMISRADRYGPRSAGHPEMIPLRSSRRLDFRGEGLFLNLLSIRCAQINT